MDTSLNICDTRSVGLRARVGEPSPDAGLPGRLVLCISVSLNVGVSRPVGLRAHWLGRLAMLLSR